MSKKTIRNLVISILILLVSAGVFLYMLFGVEAKGELLQTQVVALQTKQAQENSYFKLQRIFEESSADRDTISQYFFEQESDSIDFLNSVEALAPKVGVTLKTESLEQQVDKKTKDSWILVTFQFTGPYKNVTDFIKILENLQYESEITKVQLATLDDASWEARTTIKINVYSYDEK